MLKNWLKGFGVGLLIMLFVSVIIFVIETVAILASGGNTPPTYNILTGVLVIWFLVVIALSPYGSMPMQSTINASCARFVFIFLPISLGWFLFQIGASLWVFSVGMYISSTCVGYNIVVVRGRKKRH